MENTRRNFIKQVTAAGIGAAGLTIADHAAATVKNSPETQQKKKKHRQGRWQIKIRIYRHGFPLPGTH
jgi:hypothetical protein